MRINKTHKGKPVAVVWLDHWDDKSESCHADIKKNLKPYKATACGILVDYNKDVLALASNKWHDDDSYDGSIFYIMRCAVESIEVIQCVDI